MTRFKFLTNFSTPNCVHAGLRPFLDHYVDFDVVCFRDDRLGYDYVLEDKHSGTKRTEDGKVQSTQYQAYRLVVR